MAQTGYTPIQLYYSSTTTNIPSAGNLANGELAINITDGKLFYKDNANAVQVIGWKVVPATAGGTGQTSYAVGDLLYANTTTTLAKLADVATGNALISGGVSTAPSWGKIGLTTHVSGVLPVANGGTNASTASITSFNNITGYSASGATGTTTTNLVFSTSPSITTPTLVGDVTVSTGNVVIGTSGKGIDFSATPGTGTSELLADYEEGTWSPTLTSAGGNFTTIAYGDSQGTYTKVGRMVTVRGNLFTTGAITVGSASGQVYIAGLPFACGISNLGQIWTSPDTGNYNMPLALATGVQVNASVLQMFKDGSVNNPAFAVTDLRTAGGPSNNFFFQATYFV
jgi:hypothetical protein